jgi:hypothetical protein
MPPQKPTGGKRKRGEGSARASSYPAVEAESDLLSRSKEHLEAALAQLKVLSQPRTFSQASPHRVPAPQDEEQLLRDQYAALQGPAVQPTQPGAPQWNPLSAAPQRGESSSDSDTESEDEADATRLTSVLAAAERSSADRAAQAPAPNQLAAPPRLTHVTPGGHPVAVLAAIASHDNENDESGGYSLLDH